jgi:hypothetical protein
VPRVADEDGHRHRDRPHHDSHRDSDGNDEHYGFVDDLHFGDDDHLDVERIHYYDDDQHDDHELDLDGGIEAGLQAEHCRSGVRAGPGYPRGRRAT